MTTTQRRINALRKTQYVHAHLYSAGIHWEIGGMAMEIMRKLVQDYDVSADSVIASDPPCRLLASIMTDGPLFRSIASLIVEGIRLLDQFDDFTGKKEFENATLSALRLVEACVARQVPMEDAIRASNVALIVSGLDTLLQTLNPATMHADYLTNIASYLQHNDRLPRHGLAAAKIIRLLSDRLPTIQPKFVQYFTKNNSGREILGGFVDATSIVDVELEFGVEVDDDDRRDAAIRGKTARILFEAFIESLHVGVGGPNLAIFALGFDTRRPHLTNIENPGVNGFPQSCLHSAVHIVKQVITSEDGYTLPFSGLVEPALRLLVTLATCAETVEPTLRYLRTVHDMVYELSACPALSPTVVDLNTECRVLRSMLQGLSLNLAAIELKTLLNAGQTNQASRLIALMCGTPGSEQEAVGGTNETTLAGIPSMTTSVFGSITASTTRAQQMSQNNNRLLGLLTNAECAPAQLPTPNLRYFDSRKLAHVLSLCTEQTTSGICQCDVDHLNRLLVRELASLHGTEFAGQLGAVEKEAEAVLDYCVRYNRIQRSAGAGALCLNGWRCFVDVVCVETLFDFWPAEQQLTTLTELLTALLSRSDDFDSVAEIRAGIAETVLRLTGAIRAILRESTEFDERAKRLFAVIDPFEKVVAFVVKPVTRSPHSKMDVYGALLNVLYLGDRKSYVEQSPSVTFDAAYVSQLDSTRVNRNKSLDDRWSVLTRFGPELIELLARDSCDGPDFVKVGIYFITGFLPEKSPHFF
uniref:Uncharacterized protein n=1 Tax=Plectus sambesii TaxID=2011161 RepID=A0A914WKQ4_9BILA